MTTDTLQGKHFDEISHRYPIGQILNPDLSHLLEIEHLKDILNLTPPSRLMDFGCGSGRITLPFLKMGFDVHGVDISRKSLEELEYIYKKYREKSWGKLTLAEKIPENRKFAGIIGSDILHHIKFEKYFPVLLKNLETSGRCVFSEPNAWYLLWYPFILADWSVEKGLIDCSIPKLKKAILKAGFKKTEFAGHGLIPTRFLNSNPAFCRQNALNWGNTAITRSIAFRLIIKASL